MAEDNLITPNGLRTIQLELQWLRKVERPKIVAEVSYAASLGDRSENAEYIYGKKRLRQIDGRVTFLVKCLNKVRVISPADVKADQIRFGATVVVETEEGHERTYRIYGQHEVDVDNGIISHLSPIARALMGHKAGDGVAFRAPAGMRELEILEVRYEDQEPIPDPQWMRDLDEA